MPAHHHHAEEHGHHHHPVSVEQAASRVFKIGIGLNLLYVIAELIAGFTTDSLALLTDAGHNFSDVLSLALSLLSFQLAKAKPTQSFTYGYKKSTILAALANAMILLVVIGILGYESYLRLRQPQPVQGGIIAIIAAIGIVVNSISAFLFFKPGKGELNARGAYLHLLADALVSAGVVIAGIIISYTHWYWLDATVSLLVLTVILFSTWSLLTDSLRLSMDAVPKGIELPEVESIIQKVEGIKNVHHIHVWAMSTTENALTAHIVFDDGISDAGQQAVLAQVKHGLLHYNIQHTTLEVESIACAEKSCAGVEEKK